MARSDLRQSEKAQPRGGAFAGSDAAIDDEPPLDPAVERVRRKLVRLLLASFGIMILGLIAVFSTIVYRINTTGPDDSAATAAPPVAAGAAAAQVDIPLPAGARIVSTSLDGPHMLIHIDIAGRPNGELMLVETATGRVVRRFLLSGAPDN